MGDRSAILPQIRKALEEGGERAGRFRRIAEIIREGAGYRWVGLYEVAGEEIALVAWSGPSEPAHARFPVSEGLCGEAVRRRATIVVGDVRLDERYLETLGSTRSEIVVPILNVVTGRARGLLDVESDHVDAFTAEDRTLLERCASELAREVSPSPG